MPAAVIDVDAARADEDRLAPDRDEQAREARRRARQHRHDDVVHAPDALAQRVVDRQPAQLRGEHLHGRITAFSSPSRGARPAPRLSGSTTSASANSCVSSCVIDDARALEQAERRAHVARPVVEGAAQRERLVVQAVAVHRHDGLARQAAEEHDRAARGGERDRLLPGLRRARGLDHGLVAALLALAAAEQLGRGAARLAREREQAAERPAAEDRDALAGAHVGVVGAVHRAGERLDRGRHLGRDAVGDGVQVDARDVGGHAQQLRVGAVEQRIEVGAQLLAARGCRRGRSPHGAELTPHTRSPSLERGVLAAGDDDARVLVPERRGRRPEQHRMPAPVALRVGAAGERGLHAQHDLAGARLGLGDVLDAHVARRPVARGDHGANTTLSAWRLR